MKCPHCGSDMQPEQVFCEKCGKERLLVPVFEPEIEDSVAEFMSTIVQELSPEEQPDDRQDKTVKKQSNTERIEEDSYEKHHGSRQVGFFVTAVILLIIFISVFSISFYIYTENSYEYQYRKAQEAYQDGRFEEALVLADRCLEIDRTSFDAQMLKINIYQQQGETDKVVDRVLSLMEMKSDSQELYDILVPIYIEREQYQKINELLKECPLQQITEKYADYLALPPEFEPDSGVFDSPVSLKLIAGGTGNIYYTLDGSEPNKYSSRYTAPIRMVAGEYEVSAVYVNNYGLSSEIVTKSYVINNDIELVPEISADSGNYDVPTVISVSVPDEEYSVYYTTDGSEPTMDSNIYSTPFFMPLGHSEYRFLMVDIEGNESDIVSRSYDCNPPSVFTTDQACLILKQNLIARGEILDINGTMAGTEDKKEYVCSSAAEADGIVYYIIYEYIRGTSGTMIRSGNVYAFSVADGQIKRADMSRSGELSLSEF